MGLTRTKPLQRTAFKPKDGAPFSSFRSAGKELQRAPMKKRARKKATVAEGSKYLAACRGESCYLRVPGVCCGEWWLEAVPCHSNQSRDGKGMGLKASHEKAVPGCWACHAYIDQGSAPREQKFKAWDAAYKEWHPIRAAKMGEAMELDQ